MYQDNYKKLKLKLNLDNKVIFNHEIIYSLLPFRTRSIKGVTFENGCLPIIGVLGRIVLGKQLTLIDNSEIIEDMLEKDFIDFENNNDRFIFDLLVNEYLGGNKLNIFNPNLFLLVPLSDLEKEDLGIKLAQFVHEIFFEGIDLVDFFNGRNFYHDNIITECIMSNLRELEDGFNTPEGYYVPKCMESVVEIIKNDFKFLLNHKDFLIDNFDSIIIYYLNFYFSQFVFKNNSFTNSDCLIETYYALDWERVSTHRGDNHNEFKKLEKYLPNLLYSMEIVEHLNTILGTKSLLIPDIVDYYNSLDKSDKAEVLKYFKMLIIDIINTVDKFDDYIDKVNDCQDLSNLIKFYGSFLKKFAIEYDRSSPFTKYHDAIEILCRKYFVKQRGPNGNMFNITQEMLMIITAISIQNGSKIRFNNLINEFNKRGLFFDEESKNRIRERFNILNLIESKSDIGDEAYVKSIL